MIIPNDAKLHDQMVTRKRLASTAGRLMAESKKDMAKRGLKSPDRADAVMMAIGIKPFLTNTKADEVVTSWMDYLEEEYQDKALERAHIAGCDAGL